MRFIAAKQDLKLFQQQTTQPSFAAAAATAANETSAAAQKQAEKEEGMVNIYTIAMPFILDSDLCSRNPCLISETSKKRMRFCLIQ